MNNFSGASIPAPSRNSINSTHPQNSIRPRYEEHLPMDCESYSDPQLELPLEDVHELSQNLQKCIRNLNEKWRVLALSALNWQKLQDDLKNPSIKKDWDSFQLIRQLKNGSKIYTDDDLTIQHINKDDYF